MLGSSLDQLAKMSIRIGARKPIWIQGTGGNVSLKLKVPENHLRIKASGQRLEQVTESDGSVLLDYSELRQRLDQISVLMQKSESLVPLCAEDLYDEAIEEVSAVHGNHKRASMEAGFHARLPKSWVFHFHSLVSLLMADDWFEGKYDFLTLEESAPLGKISFVDHRLPGWELSEEIYSVQECQTLILRNHGVILQADHEAFLDYWESFEKAYCRLRGYQELEMLLNSIDNLERLIYQFGENLTPFRCYFPDTAVFFNRIRAILVPAGASLQGEKLYRIDLSSWERDRDALEIWLASVILYRTKPSLQQWSDTLAAVICNLPIEQWRKKQ